MVQRSPGYNFWTLCCLATQQALRHITRQPNCGRVQDADSTSQLVFSVMRDEGKDWNHSCWRDSHFSESVGGYRTSRATWFHLRTLWWTSHRSLVKGQGVSVASSSQCCAVWVIEQQSAHLKVLGANEAGRCFFFLKFPAGSREMVPAMPAPSGPWISLPSRSYEHVHPSPAMELG